MSVTRKHLAAIHPIAMAISLIALSACKRAETGPTGTIEAKRWTIVVGPDPCDLKEKGQKADKQKVSKQNRDYVVWISSSRESLEIRIHVPPDCPPPFANMTPSGTDKNGKRMWSLSDPNGVIYSGLITPNACETDDNGYKYDQILGTSRECDGWIVIKG